MKPRVGLKPHLSVEQIKERLYHSKNGRHASYWQIILTVSLSPGKATSEYCAYLGISDTKFHRIIALYNEQGEGFCDTLKWGGRRQSRCQISFEQEEEVLQTQVTTALTGGVLVPKQFREAVEKKVGHTVSDDYLWDMLHRHGWSKKAPRPQHPQTAQTKEEREVFKKKHPHSSSQKLKTKNQ